MTKPQPVQLPVFTMELYNHISHDTDFYGVYPSVDEAKARAGKDAGETLEWEESRIQGDEEPPVHRSTCGFDRWTISEHTITLGGTYEADTAILKAAAEVLFRRFGAITTESERAALSAGAGLIAAAEEIPRIPAVAGPPGQGG